jgi:hypothetical protein
LHREWANGILPEARNKLKQDYLVGGTNVTTITRPAVQKNNTTSGVTGVCFDRHANSWKAYISFQGKRHNLGYSKSKDEAILLRKRAEEQLHGDFLAWYAAEYPDALNRLEKHREKKKTQKQEGAKKQK